ncbi:pickpocket protein 28-like [Bicyclus anynana]|uniref:Pickpocket protein 28-like n=1 Tax=Bicyclus anynana TaxID=110368 RepID=A0ABM3LZU6_BICAN|nr:pickpocket protein 28-like [Bicyclus anynana]
MTKVHPKAKRSSTRFKKDLISSSQYVRPYYMKDFKYISPEALVTKKNRTKFGRRDGCGFIKLWLSEVLKGFKQFLYEGSLHGVKYIFEPTFSHKERVTWIVIVVISITICAMNIIQLVLKWTSTPFVNVIDSLPTPIWAVPFPSVVLCPHLHVKLSFANVSELKGTERFFTSLVCPEINKENKIMDTKQRLTYKENEMLQKFILKGSPSCSDLVKVCHWRSEYETEWFRKDCCEKLLKPIFTDYGLCYTFNSLPLNGMTNKTIDWQNTFNPFATTMSLEWDLDKGYPKKFPPTPGTLPFRVMASGEANGLGIELYLNTSEHQYECDGNNLGFNILISSPTDHVYTSTILRLPMDRMTTVEVSPISYKTDSSLRALSPDQRQCFFQNERKLQYYEFYTDTNCKLDLRIRETVKQCNCALYNWPRKHVWSPICSTKSDFECVAQVKARVGEQLIFAYYADSEEQRKPHEDATSCYPACNDVLYSTQVYYSDLMKDPVDAKMDWDSSKKGERTRINVHFYNDMFLGQHRHAQYDDYYFAGAIGGLLSLFLGFSIISVAELVYFVMLKPLHIAFKGIQV